MKTSEPPVKGLVAASGKSRSAVCLIPPHYDFLCAAVVEGLAELGYRVYCNEPTNHCAPSNFVPLEQIAPYCLSSDHLFVFSNTGYAKRKAFLLLHGLLPRAIYIDGSDLSRLEDPKAFKTYPVVFKREVPTLRAARSLEGLLRYVRYRAGLYALPFAAEQAYFPMFSPGAVKDIDVSCTLVPKACAEERGRINDLLRDMNLDNAIVGPVSAAGPATAPGTDDRQSYFKVLARSKISIAYPGLGFDTGRFWEILANRALLFSPPIGIRMPHPLMEFEHFVPYRSLDQLRERLHYYLEHGNERERIAQQAYDHLLRYHTSRERARYLVEKVSRH